MTIFHALETKINGTIDQIAPSLITQYMDAMKTPASILLSILLIWRVIQVMSGSNKKPISDVGLEVMVWSIIWSFKQSRPENNLGKEKSKGLEMKR